MGGVNGFIAHDKSSITDKWNFGKGNIVSFALVFLGLVVIFSYGMGNVAAAGNTSGGNIYVDTHGNDSWDGLSATYNGTSGPKLTVKNATETVNTGGTVDIANGYYTGAKNNNITIDKDMNIIGQSQNGTIISGSNTNWIFYIPTGVNVTICDLSLINGTKLVVPDNTYPDKSGGAIDNQGKLTINNCNLNDNKVTNDNQYYLIYGGAIYNTGDLTVNNSYFIGNTAKQNRFNSASGGAIYNTGILNIYNSTFNSNLAEGQSADGGAIRNTGTMNITLSSFTKNTIATDLGGIGGGAITNTGNMTVTCSNFTRNSAQLSLGDFGGAISNYGGTSSNPVTITGCTFTSNAATSDGPPRGGAIFNCGVMSVKNSTFTGNNAFFGGAIDNEGLSTLNVTSSIFTNNFAVNGGCGGAINNYGTLTALSNIFKNNSAGTGGAIYTPSLSYIHFNQFFGNYGGTGTDIEDNGGKLTDASLNWWGSNACPSTSTSGNPITDVFGNVTVTPWLVLTVSAKPNIIHTNKNSTVTVDLLHDSNGVFNDPSNGCVPDGIPVTFSGYLGSVNPINTTLTDGQAQTVFTANNGGTGNVTATVDGQSVNAPIIIDPPTINSISPANNSSTNIINKVIIITFNVPILAGSSYNDITVTGPSGIVSTTSQINGNILTLTPISNYTNGNYHVNIPINAVTDLIGNNLKTIFNSQFTVDTVPPTIETTTPTNNSVNIPINQVIKITFSKPIKAGNMDITLTNSKGTPVATTPSINGNILTIYPKTLLTNGKYTLNLYTGSITDLAGNNLALYGSSFTVDSIPPTIKTISPTNNAVNIPTNQIIKITFSEPIKAKNMNITLTNSKGTPVAITTSINGNILTIYPKTILTNGKYTLTLHTGSITDLAGNNLALCGSSFTVDSIPPTVKTITPTNNAVNIPTNQVIKITFSEPIKAGNMDIGLVNSTGNEVTFTKTIRGCTLTLKPTEFLSKGVKYTILLHTGCVTDLANNNLAPCTSRFTTV